MKGGSMDLDRTRLERCFKNEDKARELREWLAGTPLRVAERPHEHGSHYFFIRAPKNMKRKPEVCVRLSDHKKRPQAGPYLADIWPGGHTIEEAKKLIVNWLKL